MQDIHNYSMIGGGGGGGGGGRFYGGGIGGGGGGDRRMRAHQNTILNHHQSLKCPRCNSLNTKFCYYNNYNLSQPRHFCKNCRRYWTKGGVLRNVPVGGGCRKAKRSKSSKHPPPPSSPSSADKQTTQEVEEKSSSSESSSLTASNSTVATVTISATPVAGAEVASSVIPGFSGTDMPNLKLWSTLLGQGSSDGGVFPEIGGFTTASSIETSPFGFGGHSINQDDRMKLEDRTAQVELRSNMGYEPLDWGSGGGDQTLFDLTSTVDHAYWSQTQWTSDHDQQNGLYLP